MGSCSNLSKKIKELVLVMYIFHSLFISNFDTFLFLFRTVHSVLVFILCLATKHNVVHLTSVQSKRLCHNKCSFYIPPCAHPRRALWTPDVFSGLAAANFQSFFDLFHFVARILEMKTVVFVVGWVLLIIFIDFEVTIFVSKKYLQRIFFLLSNHFVFHQALPPTLGRCHPLRSCWGWCMANCHGVLFKTLYPRCEKLMVNFTFMSLF